MKNNNKSFDWNELNRISFAVTILLFLLWLILFIIFFPGFGEGGGGKPGGGMGGDGGASSAMNDKMQGSQATASMQSSLFGAPVNEVNPNPSVTVTEETIQKPQQAETQKQPIEPEKNNFDNVLQITTNNEESPEEAPNDQTVKEKDDVKIADETQQENVTPPSKGVMGNLFGKSGIGVAQKTGVGGGGSRTGGGRATGSGTGSKGGLGSGDLGGSGTGNGDGEGDGVGQTTGAKFYGIEVKGTKILFILDHSFSMIEQDDHGTSRMDLLKRELISMISIFGSKENKNIARGSFKLLFFSNENTSYPAHLKDFVKMNKKNAIEKSKIFVQSMFPDQGTNLYGALVEAEKIITNEKIDTLFILTDGDPNDYHDEIRKLISKIKKKKIGRANLRIMFISIGQDSDFLRELAELAKLNKNSVLQYKVVE